MKSPELFRSFPIRRMGGFDLIGSRSKLLSELSQDELKEFAIRLEADDYTFQRYHGVPQLRVWEALALHHYLDPAMLGLNRKGRLAELKRAAYKLLPSSVRLLNFVASVPPLLQNIDQGKLVCVKATDDLLQSFTTPERFKTYVANQRLGVYPQRASPRKSEAFDPASLPPELRDMWEGRELWKTIDQGGKVVPGRRSTEPDLVQFFVGRDYSLHQSEVLASILRPSYARHIGRPPKAG
jgi:hypothetical protein